MSLQRYQLWYTLSLQWQQLTTLVRTNYLGFISTGDGSSASDSQAGPPPASLRPSGSCLASEDSNHLTAWLDIHQLPDL